MLREVRNEVIGRQRLRLGWNINAGRATCERNGSVAIVLARPLFSVQLRLSEETVNPLSVVPRVESENGAQRGISGGIVAVMSGRVASPEPLELLAALGGTDA